MNRINSHYLRKLHMEIAIMKQVDHPNIIKLRDVFFGSRTVYLVMELCKGGELFDEITRKAQRGLPEPQAARLLGDVVLILILMMMMMMMMMILLILMMICYLSVTRHYIIQYSHWRV